MLISFLFSLEILNDAARKILEIIHEFDKVASYKINTQKFFALLYTNNERLERDIQEVIPLTIAWKRKKKKKTYLGINLPKVTKDMFSKKYKMLRKILKKT